LCVPNVPRTMPYQMEGLNWELRSPDHSLVLFWRMATGHSTLERFVTSLHNNYRWPGVSNASVLTDQQHWAMLCNWQFRIMLHLLLLLVPTFLKFDHPLGWILSLRVPIHNTTQIFQVLARVSYATYLIHTPVIGYLLVKYPLTGLTVQDAFWRLLLTDYMYVLLAAVLITVFIE
jgi:hypothetical protein